MWKYSHVCRFLLRIKTLYCIFRWDICRSMLVKIHNCLPKGTTLYCFTYLQVLFALVPPPTIGGGWLTFCFSLMFIGLLTAIVGDLASIFGCLIGLNDLITAITFVALGTSMPDTFASRQAALQETFADSSVGNINGSNAVNVFLGLGLPWLMSTIYWSSKVWYLTILSFILEHFHS